MGNIRIGGQRTYRQKKPKFKPLVSLTSYETLVTCPYQPQLEWLARVKKDAGVTPDATSPNHPLREMRYLLCLHEGRQQRRQQRVTNTTEAPQGTARKPSKGQGVTIYKMSLSQTRDPLPLPPSANATGVCHHNRQNVPFSMLCLCQSGVPYPYYRMVGSKKDRGVGQFCFLSQ